VKLFLFVELDCPSIIVELSVFLVLMLLYAVDRLTWLMSWRFDVKVGVFCLIIVMLHSSFCFFVKLLFQNKISKKVLHFLSNVDR